MADMESEFPVAAYLDAQIAADMEAARRPDQPPRARDEADAKYILMGTHRRQPRCSVCDLPQPCTVQRALLACYRHEPNFPDGWWDLYLPHYGR